MIDLAIVAWTWAIVAWTCFSIAIYVLIAPMAYRLIKKMAKTWIKEVLKEYNSTRRQEDIMRHVDHVRNKYR